MTMRKQQALEVLTKIEKDLMMLHGWGSENLREVIEDLSASLQRPRVVFRGGSSIECAVANEGSRHFRANILIIDEYVKMDKGILDNVAKRFLTVTRHRGFLDNPKYKDNDKYLEPNKQVYASSAWLKAHWSYDLFRTYTENMLVGRKYFVCDLPYQLSIQEGLLPKAQIEDEMSESTFDEVNFEMEMEGKWLGDNKNAFYKFDVIHARCLIKDPFPTWDMIKRKPSLQNSIAKPLTNVRRIMSVDVALMASRKHDNDAFSIMINEAIPSSNNIYMANFKFLETSEGLTTDQAGLKIMRYYYLYQCTDIVLDVRNAGVSVLDFIIKDQYDPETGQVYAALNVCNDDSYAERCQIKQAEKVIWVIKATEQFNSDMAIRLRNGFENRNINLLLDHFDGEDYLRDNYKGYNNLTPTEKKELQMPYIETDLLIHELISLVHERKGTTIRVSEVSGARKDRFSSMGYNYWVMKEIEATLKPKKKTTNSFIFNIRRPKYLNG